MSKPVKSRRKVSWSGSAEQRVIAEQIIAERHAQDEQWGGETHDDGHAERDWLDFIRDHEKRARKAAHRLNNDAGFVGVHADEYRKQMIEIAALAMAAVESHDRRRRES